jgi:hypothetical protein
VTGVQTCALPILKSLSRAEDDLKFVTDRNAKSLQGWAQVASDAGSGLERWLYKGTKQWLAGMGAIDQATGSNIVNDYKYGVAVEDLDRKFGLGKITAENYGKQLGDLGVKYKQLTPIKQMAADWAGATTEVDNYNAALAGIPIDTYRYIHIITDYSFGQGGPSGPPLPLGGTGTMTYIPGIGYVPRAARGGPLGPGLTEVGEEGPEFVLNGMVIPADVTRKLKKLGIGARRGFAGGYETGGGDFWNLTHPTEYQNWMQFTSPPDLSAEDQARALGFPPERGPTPTPIGGGGISAVQSSASSARAMAQATAAQTAAAIASNKLQERILAAIEKQTRTIVTAVRDGILGAGGGGIQSG